MLKPYLQFLNDKDADKDSTDATNADRVKSIQDHFAALTAMTSEEFTGEKETGKEDDDEMESGEEESEKAEAIDPEKVKPLRSGLTGKNKAKRKGGKDPQQPPTKVIKSDDPSDVNQQTIQEENDPKSVDYENADFGQFSSSRGNSGRNSKKMAGTVPEGQFNPWEGQENSKKGGGKQKQRYRPGNKSISYKKGCF